MASYAIDVKLNTDAALAGLTKITDAIVNVELTANKSFASIGRVMGATFNAGVKIGNSMFDTLVKGVQKFGNLTRSILSDTLALFKRLETAALAVGTAIAVGTAKAVGVASARERELAMLARTGTSPNEIQQLRAIGLSPAGTISGSFQGYARLRNMGMERDLSMGLIRGLTNASAVSGTTPEETNRAIMAIMQMKSKGRVTGEELRQQLMEALPVAGQVLQKQFGTTNVEELTKIPIDEFLQKFTKGLNDLAPAAFTSFDAIKNFKQGLKELAISFGEGFMGGDFTDKMQGFNGILEALLPTAKKLGEGLRFVVDWIVQLGEKVYQNKDAIVDWVVKGWDRVRDTFAKIKTWLTESGILASFKNIGKAISEMFGKLTSKDNIASIVKGFELMAQSIEKIATALMKVPFDKLVETFNKLLDIFNKMPQGMIEFMMTQGVISAMPGGKSSLGRGAYTAGVYGGSPLLGAAAGGALGAAGGVGGGGIGNLLATLLGVGVGAKLLGGIGKNVNTFPSGNSFGVIGRLRPGWDTAAFGPRTTSAELQALEDAGFKIVEGPGKGGTAYRKSPGVWNAVRRLFDSGRVRGQMLPTNVPEKPGIFGRMTNWWNDKFRTAEYGFEESVGGREIGRFSKWFNGVTKYLHSLDFDQKYHGFGKVAGALRFLNNAFKVLGAIDIGKNIYEGATGKNPWFKRGGFSTGNFGAAGNALLTGSAFVPGPIGVANLVGRLAGIPLGWGVGKAYRGMYGGITEEQAAEAAGPSSRRIGAIPGVSGTGIVKQYEGFYDMWNRARARKEAADILGPENMRKDAARRYPIDKAIADRLNAATNVPGSGIQGYLPLGLQYIDVQAASKEMQAKHPWGVPNMFKNINMDYSQVPAYNPNAMAEGAMQAAQQVGTVSMTHTVELSPSTLEFISSVTSPASAESLNTHMNQWINTTVATQRM